MMLSTVSKLALSWEEARQADNMANNDCNRLWKLVLLLEKLCIISNEQMIKSGDLYYFNFYRELEHLKAIRPDLLPQLDTIIDDLKTPKRP